MDSVFPGWNNARPESDREAFTERSDERQQLFEQAKAIGRRTDLPPTIWAFFQVADLELVEKVVHFPYLWRLLSERDNPDEPNQVEEDTLDVVRLWKQKTGALSKPKRSATRTKADNTFNLVPSSPLPPDVATQASTRSSQKKRKHGEREFSVVRDDDVMKRCKERDNNLCAVSRMEAIDAAHIYPWCAFGGSYPVATRKFWSTLKMFWKEEEVDNWRGKIFVDVNNSNRGTETVENMLSLTATLHRFHTKGVFALRPIQMSADKTKLELEFHWLIVEERQSSKKVELLDRPLSSANLKSSGQGYGPFFRIDPANADNYIQLVSGTRFTLSTDDPVNKPLPDPGLLQLQWHLQRVLAMSGAAGWKEEDFDDEDDNTGAGAAIRDTIEEWLEGSPSLPKDNSRRQSSRESESGDSVDGSFE